MARLSDEVRERLRQAAAKKKGRDTLMGLEQAIGMSGIDWLHEPEQQEAVKQWDLRADGYLYGPKVTEYNRLWAYGISCRYDEGRSIHSRHALKCPWVRLSYAPDWLKTNLAAAFPSRKIAYALRGQYVTAPVFPTGVVVEWFRYIWDGEDLKVRLRKYLTGYTEAYIQRNPGVGAKVRIQRLTYPVISGDVEFEIDSIDGYGRPVFQANTQTRAVLVACRNGKQDHWEVIG
jgi:hypothetical protein